MARTDAVVLGAGIVGTSVALHLVKRGLSVALVDRRGPGEETSYGNAGIIEGATIYPPAFPKGFSELASIALKRASGTNYHLAFLPQIAPWLLSFRFWSTPQHLAATARLMRPLFDLAVAEHEFLMMESGAQSYLRKTGWLILYRSEGTFAATSSERDLASEFGVPYRVLDVEAARDLEPSLAPVFRHLVHWESVASVSNPLAETRAFAARFAALGGIVLQGDVRTLCRSNGRWNVHTSSGQI